MKLGWIKKVIGITGYLMRDDEIHIIYQLLINASSVNVACLVFVISGFDAQSISIRFLL